MWTRRSEYVVLLYRLFIAFILYSIARGLFIYFNQSHLFIQSTEDLQKIMWLGVRFDMVAILYVNLAFITVSILPITTFRTQKFQRFLLVFYFISNLAWYATNFIDFIYYGFVYTRSSSNILESVEHESNKLQLLFNFVTSYWYVFLLFVLCALLWVFLYRLVPLKKAEYLYTKKEKIYSIILLCLIAPIVVAGIRGDLRKSTRPLTLIDANRYVNHLNHADAVLNTPFAIMRTLDKNTFQKKDWFTREELHDLIEPIKYYKNYPETQPNVVVIILESFGREYLRSFQHDRVSKKYESYTPFIDSLAQHSLIFRNAYANGYKSIHAMSSVLAGIPSFKTAFTSSSYVNQPHQSLVSILKDKGYETSFFHGAPNGSMGFLGYANILGFDHYYGKDEFNNNDEFDGTWAIWDEPFFQFMKQKLDEKRQPFFATMFTASSHEPFQFPEKYEGKFPKGHLQIHPCIAYTDYSLKQFFEAAKKTDWYQNTLFVMVADHANEVYYKRYNEAINRAAIPILIFDPNGKWKGKNDDLAQQIDIYPTILDMIGHPKPFRSWGRSLISDKNAPFSLVFINDLYIFQTEKNILVFDGEKTIGWYKIEDKEMKKNLLKKAGTSYLATEKKCKAFIQAYYNNILDKEI